MTDPLPLTDPPRLTDPLRPSGPAWLTDPLRVHELGLPDGPTLVLLHGFTDSGLCWPDAVRRWRHDYRIVAPDARGHGESARFDPATSGSNRFDAMVADVVALLQALAGEGVARPILVGHSMGAGVAGTVLATRPDLVRAGVLEDPPWFTLPSGVNRAPEQVTIQQGVQPFRDDCDEAVARGRAELPLWPDSELQPWGVSKAQVDLSLTDRDQIARQGPWIDVAASITRPTLLVTGGHHESVLVGVESRERLARLANSRLEVEVIPGAGHTVRRDCPEPYHQIVDPWIRERFRGAASS
jgi:pimeloyl-ACP methyl ester carboxylesterase